MRSAMARVLRVLAPSLLTVIPYFAWIPVNLALVMNVLPGGPWVWILLPPGWAIEWLASHLLDAIPEDQRARTWSRVFLTLRLGLMTLYFYVLVGRTSMLLDTPDIVAPLVGFWPYVVRFVYIANPFLGFIGVVGMVALHGWLTVRRRSFRLTTTLLIPGVFTLGLFHLFYHFPTSPLHMLPLDLEPPVQRVFPFENVATDSPDLVVPFFHRDLYVMEDESVFITSLGATFNNWLLSSHPNLARVDLSSREVQVHYGRPIRRFQSTCSDRLYAAPWNEPRVLEIDPVSFDIREFPIPLELNGYTFEEVFFVFHDCAGHRILVGNSWNPALIVWDTWSRSIVKIVGLVGEVEGIRKGDSIGVIQRNPVNGRFYVFLHSLRSIVELDGDSLEPLRTGELPGPGFDAQISDDGAWFYATSFLTGAVWKIDTESFEVVLTFDSPVHCRRAEPTPDGASLLVLSYLTGEIISFDSRTGRERVRFRVGPKAGGLFLSKNYAWVSAATGIFRIPLEALVTR